MAIQTSCIACGASDDHPKHVTVLGDGSAASHHHDCGALLTPACGVCAVLHDEAPKGAKGDKLREHLLSLPPRLWTHNADGTVSYEDAEV